jgi:nucleotide-binding universal stress UspA family protein
MSHEEPEAAGSESPSSESLESGMDAAPVPHGAVVVGVVPGEPPRVTKVAARYARALGAPLVVVHVDVTRFVSFEDPVGSVHTASIDLNIEAGKEDLETVRAEASALLHGCGVEWSVRQVVGDPALALKQLAEQSDAKLLVVGTRRRGLGESIREFFTGSVAARLAHRQTRPVLVVPLGEPVADEDVWPPAD